MLKKIKNLNGVTELQKNQQKEITGGFGDPFLSGGERLIVECHCEDGSSWIVGAADESEVATIIGFGDQCRADGGTPRFV